MTGWIWLDASVLRAVHEAQLAEHGGASGERDPGLFESAMGRPQHRAACEEPDAAALAAAYGSGIARNHPFVDGNKRTAFVAVELFLDLNGFDLDADDADCVMTMLRVSAGEMPESDFGDWIRAHAVRRRT